MEIGNGAHAGAEVGEVSGATGERLGVVLSTMTDASVAEFVTLGAFAETLGYEAALVNEGRGDALAVSQAIAHATTRITVGTNIANIHYRHPYLCAAAVRAIAEISHGRVLLGLGISHRQLLATLGIESVNGRETLRAYVAYVRRALAGEAARGMLNVPPSPYPVPIHVAGNTVESAAIAGAVGDGLMPYLTPRGHLTVLLDAARAARAAAGRASESFVCYLSLPTFVADDAAAARTAARYNLAFYAQLPNYRRQWRRAGFRAAMDELAALGPSAPRRELAARIPDALVDEVSIVGDVAECRAQLAAWRAAGVDLPLLAVSPVGESRETAVRRVLRALAPRG